jgi:hypothetical protein
MCTRENKYYFVVWGSLQGIHIMSLWEMAQCSSVDRYQHLNRPKQANHWYPIQGISSTAFPTILQGVQERFPWDASADANLPVRDVVMVTNASRPLMILSGDTGWCCGPAGPYARRTAFFDPGLKRTSHTRTQKDTVLTHARSLQSCVILGQPKWDGASSPEGGQHSCPISGLLSANTAVNRANKSWKVVQWSINAIHFYSTYSPLETRRENRLSSLDFSWFSSDPQDKCKKSTSIILHHLLSNPFWYINHSAMDTVWAAYWLLLNRTRKTSEAGPLLYWESLSGEFRSVYLENYMTSYPYLCWQSCVLYISDLHVMKMQAKSNCNFADWRGDNEWM